MSGNLRTLFLTFAAIAIAWGAGNIREAITNYISSVNNLTRLLTAVKDVDTAKAFAPAITDGIARVNTLKTQLRSRPPAEADPEDNRVVREKTPEMQEASVNLTQQVRRIAGLPSTYKELQPILSKLD